MRSLVVFYSRQILQLCPKISWNDDQGSIEQLGERSILRRLTAADFLHSDIISGGFTRFSFKKEAKTVFNIFLCVGHFENISFSQVNSRTQITICAKISPRGIPRIRYCALFESQACAP